MLLIIRSGVRLLRSASSAGVDGAAVAAQVLQLALRYPSINECTGSREVIVV